MAGTLHHAAIARRYAERIIDQDLWPAPTWYDSSVSLEDELHSIGQGWPQLVDVALDMYHAYADHWWYGKNPETWEPVAVEEQFFARIGDVVPDAAEDLADEVVTCGTDLVVRDRTTGILWIVDHKSKSFDWFTRSKLPRLEPWHKDGEQYRIHWQALVNLHLVRRAFPTEVVGGFVINRFSRKKPFLFDRHNLEVAPAVYADAPLMMLRAVQEERRIDGMVAAGRKPDPYFWNCHGKYGGCDYIDVCSAPDAAAQDRVLGSKFVVVE